MTILIVLVGIWWIFGFIAAISVVVENDLKKKLTIGRILCCSLLACMGLFLLFFAWVETDLEENVPFLNYPTRVLKYIANIEVIKW